MHRSATSLLELGAWIQIGSCVFAAIIGASFVVASLINPESARASDEELEGVLAHEIAHVSHMTKPRIMPILATVLIVVQVLFIPIPRIFIVLGAVFAMLLLLTIPGNWKTEYYADRVAAENVEAE